MTGAIKKTPIGKRVNFRPNTKRYAVYYIKVGMKLLKSGELKCKYEVLVKDLYGGSIVFKGTSINKVKLYRHVQEAYGKHNCVPPREIMNINQIM